MQWTYVFIINNYVFTNGFLDIFTDFQINLDTERKELGVLELQLQCNLESEGLKIMYEKNQTQ